MRDVLERIVGAAKAPMPGMSESPLVLCGHSMGGLVMEAAFLALLRERRIRDPLAWDRTMDANKRAGVEVKLDGKVVAFPDVVLSVNSAAHSGWVCR